MSDDPKSKEKSYDFPMVPIFGLDLGRDLGSMDSRLTRVENDIQEVKRDIKSLDTKFDAKIDALEARLNARFTATDDRIDVVDKRVDKCLVAINRIGERTRNQTALWAGLFIAVIAGTIVQILLR